MLSTGNAAMLLAFDVAADAIAEHVEWRTHEHLPARIAIPGFLRGSRWIARSGSPRYFVIYEVQDLVVLTSWPYFERLNNPTPWTEKMTRSYIGVRRALCEVAASFGAGMGETALLIRFAPEGAPTGVGTMVPESIASRRAQFSNMATRPVERRTTSDFRHIAPPQNTIGTHSQG